MRGAQSALRRAAGRRITYRRPSSGGGSESVDLTAVKGTSRYNATETDGLTTEVNIEDFLIDVAALRLGGSAVQPKAGDRIEEGGLTYEVMAPGGNEPAWRHLDAGRTTYRIHTKLIDDGA